MSASLAEVQEITDKLLEVLGVRVRAGSVTLHFSENCVQKVDVNTTPWRRRTDERAMVRNPLT